MVISVSSLALPIWSLNPSPLLHKHIHSWVEYVAKLYGCLYNFGSFSGLSSVGHWMFDSECFDIILMAWICWFSSPDICNVSLKISVLSVPLKFVEAPSHYVNISCDNVVWLTAQMRTFLKWGIDPKPKFRWDGFPFWASLVLMWAAVGNRVTFTLRWDQCTCLPDCGYSVTFLMCCLLWS